VPIQRCDDVISVLRKLNQKAQYSAHLRYAVAVVTQRQMHADDPVQLYKDDMMKLFRQGMLAGAIAICLIGGTTGYASLASAQAAKQISMRDFFKNPQEAGHQISPDGKYL
jgi:hypothetical protein